MRPESSVLFRSRGEFTEAVLAALSASRRELLLLDHDFSDWPLDTPLGVGLLSTFLADPVARLRVLVADPDWLERRAARFMATRRRHAAAIECRQVPAALAKDLLRPEQGLALAAALGADVCEIYTDVDGVFTADPRVVPKASQVRYITYEEMLELAAVGAKVLHLRCVEYARRFDLPIHVRSSFSEREGTLVISEAAIAARRTSEGTAMEQPIISGVAADLNDAKVTVVGVPDRPGEAAAIFGALAGAGINIDMIVQNVSAASTGRTDVTFTCPQGSTAKATAALESVQSTVGFESLLVDAEIAKVSLVGAGMRSNPGVSATFFSALAAAGVNVEMISTSEIRISIVTRTSSAHDAVRAVHTAFGLDADGEAVVYGGTGR
jgi:aspartate kinase